MGDEPTFDSARGSSSSGASELQDLPPPADLVTVVWKKMSVVRPAPGSWHITLSGCTCACSWWLPGPLPRFCNFSLLRQTVYTLCKPDEVQPIPTAGLCCAGIPQRLHGQ